VNPTIAGRGLGPICGRDVRSNETIASPHSDAASATGLTALTKVHTSRSTEGHGVSAGKKQCDL
jgi:hypothetical protein